MSNDSTYPIKIRVSAKFIEEMDGCEMGRYEDAERLRQSTDPEDVADVEENYKVVWIDFSGRYKTVVELRNDDELLEAYYAAASGTIGLYCKTAANNFLDKIRDKARELDPNLVRTWPYQNGY